MRSIDQTITIRAGRHPKLSLRELWLYRELFYFFAWRDIKVRYKQTVIGIGWAIIQPIIATAIFTLLFNRVAGIKTGGDIPYPVFAYVGLMYWNVFNSTINTISNSLISNQGVLTKIYFPRLIPPLSAAILGIVDFFFAAIVFIGMMIIFGATPNPLGIFAAAFGLLLILAWAIGLGLFFAAVNVRYRDVKAALPFIVQIMFFVTPIIYSAEMIPEKYRLLAYLNPATGAISSVRAGLFDDPISWAGVGLSILVTILVGWFGLWYFRRVEKDFVDII